jgi:hypothetical protein
MTNKLLAVASLLGIFGTVLAARHDAHGSAPPACKVQGVWERIATIQAGKRTEFPRPRQAKVVTKRHFMWYETAARRDTIPLRTALDSARYSAGAGGYGTYDVSDHKYTEHIDLFVSPAFEGKSLTASCRVEGKEWYHSYKASDLGGTSDSVTEIWRRVE